MRFDEGQAEEFDVLIIGAGINGAGLFRDLCAQGLRCLLVEKGDFGSGTSAAPSRLIHGGLKYLETGEFRLVAESTYERNLLLRNAAHLVRPLPTILPIFSWTRGIWAALRTLLGSKTAPRSRGAVLVEIGLWLYDFYGARARQMPRHQLWRRAKAQAEIPALTPRIVAAGTYYDATVLAPERLVLELVQDGLRLSEGSGALNWTAVCPSEPPQPEGAPQATVTLASTDGRARIVRPKLVINAAGPWIDRVNAMLGIEGQLIGGTKGAHILLDHPELLRQLDGRMIYFEGNDGRILLVFPFQGKALVGSTDIPCDRPDEVACTAEETAYFLRSLKELLPGLAFDEGQIVYAYAGIRPLPNAQGVAPGLISRDHSAPMMPAGPERAFGVISLVGGKWTTFRAFSAEVADQCLTILGRARRCTTDEMAIGGGRGMPRTRAARATWVAVVAGQSGASEARVEQLLERYGTTAQAVALHEGAAPIHLAGAMSEAEIDWIARHERVGHLEDILLRRTVLAITGQLSLPLCQRIAEIAGAALGWDAARVTQEVARSRAVLAARHGVTL
jgi:glycerol-3-phosphate dehydrogenase